MLQCWDSLSDERPTFSEMVVTLDNMLTSMASYVDFNQFTLEVEEQKGYVVFIYNMVVIVTFYLFHIIGIMSTTDEESSEL